MKNRNKKKIISPDVDGLITTGLLFAIHGKSEIVGFYDGFKLETKEEFDFFAEETLNEIEAIDIDMNFVRSQGHHYQIKDFLDGSEVNNLNVDFEVENYFEKCPFSSVVQLIAQDEKLKKITEDFMDNNNYQMISFLLYADNFLDIFVKYNENCKRWLERVGLTKLKTFIEDNLNKLLEVSKEWVEKFSPFLRKTQYNSGNKTGSLPQRIEQGQKINFLNYILSLFDVEPIADRDDDFVVLMKPKIKKMYSRLNASNFKEELDVFLSNKKDNEVILSHAVIRFNEINISLIEI